MLDDQATSDGADYSLSNCESGTVSEAINPIFPKGTVVGEKVLSREEFWLRVVDGRAPLK